MPWKEVQVLQLEIQKEKQVEVRILLFLLTESGSSMLDVWPPPRHVHTAVTHHDKMYIFGGFSWFLTSLTEGYGEGTHLGDFYEYNFGKKVSPFVLILKADGKWTEIKSKGAPSPRHSLSCVAYNNSLYFFGGICDKGIMDDLFEFNLGKYFLFFFWIRRNYLME